MPVKVKNFAHARAGSDIPVGVVDVVHPRAGIVGLGQKQGERRFVGDKGLDPVGVVGDQGESGDGATAAPEYMSGPVADRLQDAAYVVGQQIGLAVLVAIFDCAAEETSGVVVHDGVIAGQQRGNGGESRDSHRMAYQHERRA